MDNFNKAQAAYDNMIPPEEPDFNEDEEPEEDNSFDIDEYEDQQQILAIEKDHERFLNWLYK